MSEITITADPNYFEGTINGRPIAGYHMVQYGETQEYLESLVKEGVILIYNKDNLPEEGKLTLTKPNPEPVAITVVANPTDALPSMLQNPADTTVSDTAALIAGLKSYLEGIAPKMSDIDSLTDEEVAAFNETLKSYKEALRQAGVATCLADTTLDPRTDTGMNLETLDPRTDTSLTALLDSYIAALNEKEAKTTDTTVTDTTALIARLKSYLEEIAPKMSDIDSLTDEEVASFNETLKSYKEALRQAGVATCLADTTLDPRTDTGMNLETLDPRTDTSLTALLDSYIAALDEKEAKTAGTTSDFYPYPISTNNVTFVVNPDRNLPDQLVCWVKQDDDLPSGYVFTTEYTEEFEEKLKKAMESYFNAPIRRDPDDTRVAFVSTVDAKTEAVTSVQVACAEDGGWRTIGTLNNPDGIDWKYQAGNLTGSGTASVVWHAQELGALGVWTDGTDNWTAVDGWFDANWSMLGCGDFDGDGKDSVLMSLYGGLFYSVDLDGTLTSLGDLNWSGWEFGAVGDFAGDGKDDIVLLHRESGTVVMLADGNADSFERLGQLDASDWSVAGAGDLDGDGKADLLVRQTSTGLAGAYASADMSQWSPVTTDYLLA